MLSRSRGWVYIATSLSYDIVNGSVEGGAPLQSRKLYRGSEVSDERGAFVKLSGAAPETQGNELR